MGNPPVILAFGLRPERLVDTEGRIDCFLEAPAADQLDVVVRALRSGLDAGGALVVVIPDWFDPDGVARLQTAMSLVDSPRIALHPTALPPLAATTLASLTSAAGAHAPSAGVLASVLGDLEAHLHVITWLGSVSGLRSPAPTLGQHLGSLAPGSAFAVSSFPEPAVHRLQGADAGVPLPPIRRPSRLAVCDHGGDARWIHGPVNEALGRLPVRDVAPTPAGPKWWGTSKLVEAVAYPVDVPELMAQLLAGRETWPCRWCGELVARAPCPMCGHRGAPVRQHGAPT